jgi:hypothetical protein
MNADDVVKANETARLLLGFNCHICAHGRWTGWMWFCALGCNTITGDGGCYRSRAMASRRPGVQRRPGA